MNREQIELLKKIVNDKFSIGAFSGMIFNASLQSHCTTTELIEKALDVRLTMERLAE